ncbi:glycosyltransferase family 4 protein [candidate division KSB1 bacterium]|nr:glycosyltransferase family 4 protein [candidate division KSB1 bacterium]
MKILIISKIFPNSLEPHFGTFVFDETKALSKIHEVQVVAPIPWFPEVKFFKTWYKYSQMPMHEFIENIPVYHPTYLVTPKIGRMFYGYFLQQGLKKTIEEIHSQFKFDLILVHYAYPEGLAAAYFSKKYNCPLVLKIHGSDINIDVNYWGRRIGVIKALNAAHVIFAVSEALKRKIVTLGIPSTKIQRLYNAVDAGFTVQDQTLCRQQLNLLPDKKYILFVGNLIPIKGISNLIEAFHQYLIEGNSDVNLLLIGTGPLRSFLQQKIENLNLEDRITLVGARPHAEIPIWMNACDLLCLPSYNEGFPVTLIEARACGLPFVASCVGGIPELVTTTDSDLLVPPGDINALGMALKQKLSGLKSSPSVRISRFNRTWKDVAEEMTEVFMTINQCQGDHETLCYFNNRY